MADEDDFNHILIARGAKQIADAGGSVQVRPRTAPGLGAHWEMWMLGQGGFAPIEVLRAATIHGAKYSGWMGKSARSRRESSRTSSSWTRTRWRTFETPNRSAWSCSTAVCTTRPPWTKSGITRASGSRSSGSGTSPRRRRLLARRPEETRLGVVLPARTRAAASA